MKLRNLALLSVGAALVAIFLRVQFPRSTNVAGAAKKEPATPSRTPAEYRRAPELTFLTFPEWYLVYSPDEYADLVAESTPDRFPFRRHIDQFWQGYGMAYDATGVDYPFNTDYHVMIWVIGGSTTVEYGLKGAYEAMVGRLTAAIPSSARTAEDRLAANVARDYVEFLNIEPWYKFDFVSPLRRVWTETGFWGPNPIRSWERKYYLTSEYAAKAIYGWVIKKASESAYEEEKPVTAVLVDRLPNEIRAKLPDVKVIADYPDGSVLASLPRYQAFTDRARTLAQADVHFLEIAGNQGSVLLSAIVPTDYDDSALEVLLRQPIITRPGLHRVVFTVPVPELTATIRRLDRPPLRLEHIYDY
jgi:hypothetical protein